MKLLAISIVSWLAGLGAYLGSLWIFWGQTVRGDLHFVVFWSGLAATVAVAVAYAPAMFTLRRRVVARSWWPFPVAGATLGIVPVVFIAGIWSNNLAQALVSPEAGLFFFMFGTFGAVFGAGFFLAYVRRSV